MNDEILKAFDRAWEAEEMDREFLGGCRHETYTLREIGLKMFLSRQPEIDALKADIKEALASHRTLAAYANIHGICPKCGEYRTIDGYVCFGCGHDSSYEEVE